MPMENTKYKLSALNALSLLLLSSFRARFWNGNSQQTFARSASASGNCERDTVARGISTNLAIPGNWNVETGKCVFFFSRSVAANANLPTETEKLLKFIPRTSCSHLAMARIRHVCIEQLYRVRDLQNEMKARSSRTRSVPHWPFFRLQPPTWMLHEKEQQQNYSHSYSQPVAQSLARIMFKFMAGDKKKHTNTSFSSTPAPRSVVKWLRECGTSKIHSVDLDLPSFVVCRSNRRRTRASQKKKQNIVAVASSSSQ